MALLPYVDESKASEKTREILDNTPKKMNVARMIANSSEAVFHNFSRLGNSLMTRGKLNHKLREIAILRTAKVSDSAYEWTQHVPIAKAAGVTVEELKKHLGAGEIVELIMAIGFWGMVARMLETTEVEIEDWAGSVNMLAGMKKR